MIYCRRFPGLIAELGLTEEELPPPLGFLEPPATPEKLTCHEDKLVIIFIFLIYRQIFLYNTFMILKNIISQFHTRIFRSYIKKTIIFSQLYQIRESYNNILQNFTWINCWVLCVFGPWAGLGMRTSRFSRKLPKVASNYYLNYLLSFMCVFGNNIFDKDFKILYKPDLWFYFGRPFSLTGLRLFVHP